MMIIGLLIRGIIMVVFIVFIINAMQLLVVITPVVIALSFASGVLMACFR
jgi:hypothetical protein